MENKLKQTDMKYSLHLCVSLKKYRDALGLSLSDMERHGLNHTIVHNIESGENCSIDKLFMFLGILNEDASSRFILKPSFKSPLIISSKTQLGCELKKIREERKMSMLDMKRESGILERQVISIEKGKGYTLKTLNKYFDALHSIDDFDAILY